MDKLSEQLTKEFQELLKADNNPASYRAAKNLIRDRYHAELATREGWCAYMRVCSAFKPAGERRNGRQKKDKKAAREVKTYPIFAEVEERNPRDRKSEKINFSEMMRHMIEATGMLPYETWLNELAKYLGFSDRIASSVLKQAKEDYDVTRTGLFNGYKFTPKVDPIDEQIKGLQDQIAKLRLQQLARRK